MPVRGYDPDYLSQALDSLLRQTDPRWRLIIIEDPDAPDPELASIRRDDRIQVVRNEGRKLAGALNTGMRRAETGFAAILFADDLWAPRAVEVLTRHIDAHPRVDFFHSARRIVDDEGESISSIHPSVHDVRVAHFVSGSPVKHLLCWRIETALAIGGMDESLDSVGPDDWDFPWSMAESGARFMAISDCLYVYRDHRRSFRLTTHLPLSVHTGAIRRIMRKHGASRRQVRRVVATARASYLRQCLYGSRFDRWARRVTRVERRQPWRETYS
jgi:glycosyltransferase involved in cell wall biosynthesis